MYIYRSDSFEHRSCKRAAFNGTVWWKLGIPSVGVISPCRYVAAAAGGNATSVGEVSP